MHFANRPLLIHVEMEGGGRKSNWQTQHNRSKQMYEEATVDISQVYETQSG